MMNKNQIKGTTMEMRRPTAPKSEACPKGRYVYLAQMSRKVCAHYPGRPRSLPKATAIEKSREGGRGVSRGHSKRGNTPKARRKGEANTPSCR